MHQGARLDKAAGSPTEGGTCPLVRLERIREVVDRLHMDIAENVRPWHSLDHHCTWAFQTPMAGTLVDPSEEEKRS